MTAPLLHPYQQRWLADPSRFKLGMMSRQVGKTFTCTLELVLDCLQAEAAGSKRRWVILSRGERQAREAMTEGVQRHLQALQATFKVSLDVDWSPAVKAHEATLPNGSRITALPANPDTARGFSASVLLDEFAFHQDSRAIWRALFPVISAGHQLRLVSTPNGKGNQFYDLATAGQVQHAAATWLASPAGQGADLRAPDRWGRHVVDIYQAVAEGLPRDIDALREGINDADAWAQEFELQWLDEASAWLPYELIDAAEHPLAGDPARYEGGPVYVGMDIAARGDLTVLWALEQVGDVLWERERVELRRAPFAVQLAELDRLMGHYRVIRAALDQTGMGEAVVQQAQERHGFSRVHGVLFSPAAKLDLATRLKDTLEDRRLRLTAGDRPLRADLHAVRRVAGPTGIPRLVAERDASGHADRFWALALAVSVAATDAGPLTLVSTGRRDSADLLLGFDLRDRSRGGDRLFRAIRRGDGP